jgi:hypothetical protein
VEPAAALARELAAFAIDGARGKALALPVSGALRAEVLTGFNDHILRDRAATGQESTDPSGRRGLQQPAVSAARGTEPKEGIERLAVHAGSPLPYLHPADRGSAARHEPGRR